MKTAFGPAVIQFTAEDATLCADFQPADFTSRTPGPVHWVNLCGFPAEETWAQWKEVLKLNPHMMLDAVNAKQRPLMEEYEEALFLSVKSIVKRKGSRVKLEHISFVLTGDYVLSIQQKQEDRFTAVWDRVREARGIVRHRPVDYLLYRLMEAVVLPYGEAISALEDHLDQLEVAVVKNPQSGRADKCLGPQTRFNRSAPRPGAHEGRAGRHGDLPFYQAGAFALFPRRSRPSYAAARSNGILALHAGLH